MTNRLEVLPTPDTLTTYYGNVHAAWSDDTYTGLILTDGHDRYVLTGTRNELAAILTDALTQLRQVDADLEAGHLRECDTCGTVTDAGAAPDWPAGNCPDCHDEANR